MLVKKTHNADLIKSHNATINSSSNFDEELIVARLIREASTCKRLLKNLMPFFQMMLYDKTIQSGDRDSNLARETLQLSSEVMPKG